MVGQHQVPEPPDIVPGVVVLFQLCTLLVSDLDVVLLVADGRIGAYEVAFLGGLELAAPGKPGNAGQEDGVEKW